jgi:hypothetical protein
MFPTKLNYSHFLKMDGVHEKDFAFTASYKWLGYLENTFLFACSKKRCISTHVIT